MGGVGDDARVGVRVHGHLAGGGPWVGRPPPRGGAGGAAGGAREDAPHRQPGECRRAAPGRRRAAHLLAPRPPPRLGPTRDGLAGKGSVAASFWNHRRESA
eukprot:7625026-Pyramimonas_sp.AAC.1